MDQYTSTVVIAIITGIFSVITLIIQKKQDVVINKIDEQTMFIEKEKTLQQKRSVKEKQRENVIHRIMLLILDTNLYILTHELADSDLATNASKEADALKKEFNAIESEIHEIDKEYELLMDLSEDFKEQAAAADQDDNKKKK